MQDQEPLERGRTAPSTSDSTPDAGWTERGRQWHEELKEEEGNIAPWLNLEWTGQEMRVERG